MQRNLLKVLIKKHDLCETIYHGTVGEGIMGGFFPPSTITEMNTIFYCAEWKCKLLQFPRSYMEKHFSNWNDTKNATLFKDNDKISRNFKVRKVDELRD